MAFKDERRQNLLSEPKFIKFASWLENRAKHCHVEAKKEDHHPDTRRSFASEAAFHGFELLALSYTAGKPVAELRDKLPAVIQAFIEFIPFDNPPDFEAQTFEITQHEAYVYIFWLLALSALLGYEEYVTVILSWLDRRREFNRGRDGLFEAVVEKLTGEKESTERVLLHPDAYRPLAKATVSEPEERPALVKDFVEKWYRHMNPCYWHGQHTDNSFFGYWCFEAALVTYLWDIDDSSYRDHKYYPKDLVDYARENFPRGQRQNGTAKLRCEANSPCPKTGYWSTPAKLGSRRHFQQGEIMPDFPASTYGITIWMWDQNQD